MTEQRAAPTEPPGRHEPGEPQAAAIFSRVLVGIDGSPEALEAASQAATLVNPSGRLMLLAAWAPEPPLVTPMTLFSPPDEDEQAALRRAEETIAGVRVLLPRAAARVARGLARHVLLEEIRASGWTLVAVGSHGQGRAEGILAGSTATRLVHDAPCAVLLARRSTDWYPRRIAVGVDGSTQSAAAYAAAAHLARRFEAELEVVVARDSRDLDRIGVFRITDGRFELTRGEPVPVLTAAAARADLLVLGSRGLRGVRALGSVAERVAHRAASSVLIVRGG
jgi:nucleotide-binding universal stress UspA family protein